MTVLIINGNRYLINEESKACDKRCENIIKSYPTDATVEFGNVEMQDVKRKTVKELIQENRN